MELNPDIGGATFGAHLGADRVQKVQNFAALRRVMPG